MVGGFVEHQQVGLAENEACQRHALHLAAGECPRRAVNIMETECGEKAPHTVFHVPVFMPGGCRHGVLKDGFLRVVGGILLQIAYAQAVAGHYPPSVVILLPGDDAHEGGLAGAVFRHYADFVALVDAEGEVGKEHTVAERLAEVLYLEVTDHFRGLR